MTSPHRRAAVVGTGLIGGSIGLALRRLGLARHRQRPRPGPSRAGARPRGPRRGGRRPDAESSRSSPPGVGRRPAWRARRWRRRRDRHRCRQREGRRSSARVGRPPASSAATRWPAPSRRASTAPTPSCSQGATWVLTPTDDDRPRGVRPCARRRRRRSVPTWWPSPPIATTQLVAVVSHVPAPHRGHAHGSGRRRRPRSTRPCCGWPPAASGT